MAKPPQLHEQDIAAVDRRAMRDTGGEEPVVDGARRRNRRPRRTTASPTAALVAVHANNDHAARVGGMEVGEGQGGQAAVEQPDVAAKVGGAGGGMMQQRTDGLAQLVQPLRHAGPKNEKQQAVVDAFKWAWKAYKADAWGKDELKPISHSSETWFNLGLTLVDSLDTMLLMGLNDE